MNTIGLNVYKIANQISAHVIWAHAIFLFILKINSQTYTDCLLAPSTLTLINNNKYPFCLLLEINEKQGGKSANEQSIRIYIMW